MISIRHVKEYCKEDITLIENYDKAIADTTQTWVCHHRDEVKVLPSGIKVIRTIEELKENGRYYGCPANELIFLTKSEHNTVHNKGIPCRNREILVNKPRSEFGIKYFNHYGYSEQYNVKQYKKEHKYYKQFNKCSWE